MAGRTYEITEEELASNQKLRKTVQAILANPIAKLKVQEATKIAFPTAITPELDQLKYQYAVKQELANEVTTLKQQIAADKQAREEQERFGRLAADYEAGFKNLRDQGYTEAGITEVKKIMEEKGILDHGVAAAYFEKLHPPQDPIRPGSGSWNFMEQVSDDEADLKKLIESKGREDLGMDRVVDKIARDALLDIRGQPRR